MEVNEQMMWEETLGLIGKNVAITFAKDGSKISGTVTYASFDSLMLNADGKQQCIAYRDVLEMRAE